MDNSHYTQIKLIFYIFFLNDKTETIASGVSGNIGDDEIKLS